MKYFLIFLFAFVVDSSYGQPPAKSYVLKVAKMYDSEANTFVANQQILVKGKKIVKVASSLTKAETDGAEVITLNACTVTPGFIDAHTHVFTIQKLDSEPLETDMLMNSDIERSYRSVKIARSYLDAGFTTIRDLGNSGQYLDLNLKRALNKGWVIGPRMIVSGPIIAPEDGQFFNLSSQNRFVIDREYTVIRNVTEARQAVKDHISHGVDVIKVVMGDGRLTLPLEEVKAMVETAHSFGIKLTAHATYDAVIATALQAGVDGIEHGYGISDSLLDIMARQKVYLVPTIGTAEAYAELFDPNHKQTPQELKNLNEWATGAQQIVKRAIDKGVMVVNGSDMYAYTTKPQAVAAMNTVEAYYAGVRKANDVLRTATRNAAVACGLEKVTGIIKENYAADIVAFDGDLEKDFVKGIYKVKFIMKEGEIFLR
jgi:imidazolonepropionase-like amidohydrolase